MKYLLTFILLCFVSTCALSAATVRISWNWAGKEATLKEYRLLVDKNTNGTVDEVKIQSTRVNGEVVKFIDYVMPDGATYSFRVSAVDTNGFASGPSARLIYKAPAIPVPPPAPTDLKGEDIPDGEQ